MGIICVVKKEKMYFTELKKKEVETEGLIRYIFVMWIILNKVFFLVSISVLETSEGILEPFICQNFHC